MDQGFAIPTEEPRSESSHRRAENRGAMLLQAHIRVGHSIERHPIRVRNLSSGGLMGDAPIPLRKGEAVIVTFGGVVDQTGRVCWVKGTRFGIAFSRPINPKVLRQPSAKRPTTIIIPPYKDGKRPALRVR